MEHPNTRSPSPPVGIVQRNLGRHAALGMASAAVDEAERLGVHVNVAVVDRHGTLMAFLRMPDASLISVQTAMDKAYSAASARLATSRWVDVLAGFPEVVRQNILQRPRLVVFGGGIPVELDGEVIGAIGVSGGSVEEDERCAVAGLQAVLGA